MSEHGAYWFQNTLQNTTEFEADVRVPLELSVTILESRHSQITSGMQTTNLGCVKDACTGISMHLQTGKILD